MAATFIPPPPFPATRAEFAWEIRHARVFEAKHDGALPDDVFWRYSVTKHDINPRRFDRWHPVIGHMIEKSRRPHPAGPTPPAIVIPPPPEAVGGETAVVPEPAGWLLLATGFAAVMLGRRKGRKVPS